MVDNKSRTTLIICTQNFSQTGKEHYIGATHIVVSDSLVTCFLVHVNVIFFHYLLDCCNISFCQVKCSLLLIT